MVGVISLTMVCVGLRNVRACYAVGWYNPSVLGRRSAIGLHVHRGW